MKTKPMVIGHRGAAGEAPENTLASFELALEQGCEGIELDVHLSKDGEIMVCHDATLDRTTGGTGYIYAMNASEIKQLDAGSWFSERFEGEKVPLLDEVFDRVPGRILINVEIKHTYGGQMEARLLDFLRQRKRLDNVVISSFDHKCMSRVKKMEPKAKVGLLYAAHLVNHAAYAKMLEVEVYSLHPHYQLFGSEDMEKAAESGYQVYPYTVDSLEELSKMIDCGVSGIITNFPARLVNLLK